MIVNKLHKLLELVDDDSPLARDLRSDPMFLFDDDVVKLLLQGEASTKSLEALATVGLCHLPYPKMTLQFTGQGPSVGYSWFVSMREIESGKFWARTAWFHPKLGAALLEEGSQVTLREDAFVIDTKGSKADAYASAGAAKLAVLMTHVGGFEREHIEAPTKLNKKRQASGKPPVQSYSYIRVGHYYTSSGDKEYFGKSGRRMPIHMRAGHTRNQFYGKDRAERKLIWIPPVLVNYKPEAQDQPILEKRVKL